MSSGSASPRDVERARRSVAAVPYWWHSIEVAPGVITPGRKTPEIHASELASFQLPDLTGKSVLDVGGWDGFYAFHAEELGARRVALLDSYGRADDASREMDFWHPGKRGFDTARELRGSRVEAIVADFMTVPADEVGVWDVVFFLGVLYHLEDPLGGLRRLAALTTELAVIQTQAIAVIGQPTQSVWEFYPGEELAQDPSNWWAPTASALSGALLAAGFTEVQLNTAPPTLDGNAGEIVRFGLVALARKGRDAGCPQLPSADEAQDAEPQTARARARVAAVPYWWHSIEVAPGVITPGYKTPEIHAAELASFRLPDLTGKSVLDVGGWDGFYAFQAEELGARRVALMDHYTWTLDLPAFRIHAAQCAEQGLPLTPAHATEFWHPETLPGKRGFDTAHELRGSSVEAIVADFMATSPDDVGVWDVVLFLGVLYHLEDPLGGLRRLAAVTGELAIVEVEAITIGGRPQASFWEFYPTNELADDASNWFVPTTAALRGALLAAGFARVELLVPPPPADPTTYEVVHYRAVAHAFK